MKNEKVQVYMQALLSNPQFIMNAGAQIGGGIKTVVDGSQAIPDISPKRLAQFIHEMEDALLSLEPKTN